MNRSSTNSLIQALAGLNAPTRPLPSPRRLLLVWLALLVAANSLLFLGYGFRPDLTQQLHNPFFLVTLGGWLAVVFSGIAATLALARPRWPLARQVYLAVGMFALVFGLFITTLLNEVLHAPLVLLPGALALQCILVSSILAAVAGVAGQLILRRARPSSPGLLALAVGFTAAAAGMLAISLNCPSPMVQHILLSHLLPALCVGGAMLLVTFLRNRW